MIKNIRVGEKDLVLSNSIAWTMIYRDQFGHDIVSTLTPVLAAALDVISGFFADMGTDGAVGVADIMSRLDGDTLLDALSHISAFELVDVLHITWAMAKAADDSLPDPRRWVSEFEVFPVDEIVPAVVMLAAKGMISTKNLKRLMSLKTKIKTIQPLTSTPSSSPGSSED